MNKIEKVAQTLRSVWGRFAASALLVIGLTSGRAMAELKTPTAITNVTIVTGPGSTIQRGSIVLFHGHVMAVGADIEVPAYAEKVDGTGLIAYAGFVDAQAHLGISSDKRTEEDRLRTEDVRPDPRQGPLAATRFANRRGLRPQYRALAHYAPDKSDLSSHRLAGFTVALITPRDEVLSGTSDLMALSDAPIRRCVLRGDVAMHGSFQTGEDGNYPRTLLGIFAEFRQVMLDAQWYTRMRHYAQRHSSVTDRPPTDAALDALQPLLGGSQRLIFEANSENEIRRALNLAKEFNLDVAISGAREAWKVIDRIKEEHIPLIVSLKFDEEPEYGKKKKKKSKSPKGEEAKEVQVAPDASHSAQSTGQHTEKSERTKEHGKVGGPGKPAKKKAKKIYEPLKVRKERRRLWEEQVANTIRLHESSVPFALRTSDFPKLADFWKNLRLVMERGLPEEAALAALTTTPADLFGLGDQLGTIRRGRIANLTLMTKTLSDKKAKVKFVFIDGRKFKIEQKTGKGEAESKSGDKTKGGQSGRHPFAVHEEEEPEEAQEAEASAEKTGEKEVSPKDKGPTWEAEIKADRIPKTHTGGNVLIRGATIMPVSSPPLTNASILIRNGKIEQIGDVDAVANDVTVIDGTGRFVIPGFVDAHSHLGIDGVNESALAISAEVRIADLINPQSVGIFRAVAGGTTTHHVLHGSANPIGGQNAIVKTKYGRSAAEMLLADAPRTIKFALGENVTQANWQQAWGKRFPNTRMGVEAVIRTAMEAGRAYDAKWKEYERLVRQGHNPPPPRRDLRLEALADVVTGRLTVHSHCYRSDEILRLLSVAEDYGFRIGTLQHVLEGYRVAPEIARHGAGASTFSNFWAYKVEAFGAIPYNAALMTRHGITVSLNSDSPNTIRYFGLEAAKSIKWGGLTANQALRLVTLNPAKQLQIDDRIGSLEIGKDGDVAIFNGHPLNSFSKCVMSLIEGEVYFEDSRPEPTEPCDSLNLPGDLDRTIPQTPHRAYAITGATIHPISGPVIEHGTVVIVEDKIFAVGTDVAIPPGAGVIDAAGLHVYPGLIDAESSLGTNEIGSLRATRDYSDIARFSPQLHAASAVNPHSVHIRISRTAGITTAVTSPQEGGGFRRQPGAVISGQSAIMHLDGWTVNEMLLVDPLALHMSVPSLPVHLRGRDPKQKEKQRKEHKKRLRELNEFMDKAKHYAQVKKLAKQDPQIDFDVDLVMEAMVPYVRGDKPVVFAADSYKQILDTIEFAEKHDLRCVLSGAREAWKLADTLAKKDIPVILASPLSYPRGRFEPWDSVYRCAGVLARAGVRFCFASQSASGAYNLALSAGMAVAHGLTRRQAEYALTLGAAKILGIDGVTGSIEPGKMADLIVTTDTPLQTVSQVTHMFIAGKPIELTSLHTEEYEKFRNRPDPVLPPPPFLRGPPSLTVVKSKP